MNGAQDLGGTMGHGPIGSELNEPIFHHDWERTVFALASAIGIFGQWSIDEDRHACESLKPARYLSSSYYEIWLAALVELLKRHGFVSADEVASGHSFCPAMVLSRPALAAAEVADVLATGDPASRQATTPARFEVGDIVRTRNINPEGHTRLPRYLRARRGEVVWVHGVHVFPDSNAHGAGEDPQWLYSVRFVGRELWGEDGGANDSVHADLWEPYLVAD